MAERSRGNAAAIVTAYHIAIANPVPSATIGDFANPKSPVPLILRLSQDVRLPCGKCCLFFTVDKNFVLPAWLEI